MQTSRRALATALVALMVTLTACTAANPASNQEGDAALASPPAGSLPRNASGSGSMVVADPNAPVSSPIVGGAPGEVPVAPLPEPILGEPAGSAATPISGSGGTASSGAGTTPHAGPTGAAGGGVSGMPGTGTIAYPTEPAGSVDGAGPAASSNFQDVRALMLDDRNLLVAGRARVWEGVFEIHVLVNGQVQAVEKVALAEGAPAFSPFEMRIMLAEPLTAPEAEVQFVTESARDGSLQVEYVTTVPRGN